MTNQKDYEHNTTKTGLFQGLQRLGDVRGRNTEIKDLPEISEAIPNLHVSPLCSGVDHVQTKQVCQHPVLLTLGLVDVVGEVSSGTSCLADWRFRSADAVAGGDQAVTRCEASGRG